jgi:methylated-DNA-[protein]-cysteine S-methyltransferase
MPARKSETIKAPSSARGKFDAVIPAPFGRVGIMLRGDALVDISFLNGGVPLEMPKTAAARRVCKQLGQYFRKADTRFSAELELGGTPFQQRVWRALRRIAPGDVVHYGALARRLKTSSRAVGNACRRNPVPIIVPCHRVVAANGDGGFMGKRGGRALAIKRWSLAHEREG